LIFQDEKGGLIAKMIDFGFSTRYVAEGDRFPLGMTIPWNAPEHDRESQWFDVGQAKKTDIFSFGMLCFWLLFTNFLDGTTPLPESCRRVRRMTHASGNYLTIEHILEDLKAEKELHVVALEFVTVTDSIEDVQKIELAKLFSGSLQCEAEDRVKELQDVLSGLVKRL
jgi:serine/threonine protein kinase